MYEYRITRFKSPGVLSGWNETKFAEQLNAVAGQGWRVVLRLDNELGGEPWIVWERENE